MDKLLHVNFHDKDGNTLFVGMDNQELTKSNIGITYFEARAIIVAFETATRRYWMKTSEIDLIKKLIKLWPELQEDFAHLILEYGPPHD